MKWSAVRGSLVVVAAVAILALAGCAKRPAVTAVAAPAPAMDAASRTAEPGAGPAPSSPTEKPAGQPASPVGRATETPGTSFGVAETPPAARAETPPPAPAPIPPREFQPTDALQDVHFDFDKYDIRPGDARILDRNAGWMKANANYLVLIEGHADERGTNEYNLALGERRAKAVMNYLVAQGIQASRLTIISYGEERPLCTDRTEACWARNRRAHFLVKPQ